SRRVLWRLIMVVSSLGEDRALRRLQPARRECRVIELRYPARCLPNRGAMAPALLFRSTGLDLLRHLKVSVLASLDSSGIRSYFESQADAGNFARLALIRACERG